LILSCQYCTPSSIEVISTTITPTTYPTNPQATPPPPPPPHLPSDPPSSPDCEETTPNRQGKKRKRPQQIPQKKRDKINPPKSNKKAPASQHTKPFNCYTINIRGLTQQKSKAILNHPATKDLHAIVITENHLPFRHTPSYVTKSGWVFHTIQTPYKKDNDGHPTLGACGGIFLAIRKNTSPFREKYTTKLIYMRQ